MFGKNGASRVPKFVLCLRLYSSNDPNMLVSPIFNLPNIQLFSHPVFNCFVDVVIFSALQFFIYSASWIRSNVFCRVVIYFCLVSNKVRRGFVTCELTNSDDAIFCLIEQINLFEI